MGVGKEMTAGMAGGITKVQKYMKLDERLEECMTGWMDECVTGG